MNDTEYFLAVNHVVILRTKGFMLHVEVNTRNTQSNAGLQVYSTLYLRFSLIWDVMPRMLAAIY
jgi:hypothetical protein